ncbi:unnamed protein product [Effrenium voratum]|nr:unnamed protein product [Effrenium voratum]
MGAQFTRARPAVGDLVVVVGDELRLGRLFADDGTEQPFLVRFTDALEPELAWFGTGAVQIFDPALEEHSAVMPLEQDNCPICFTAFDEESHVITPCNHSFCRQCIEKALAACQTGDPTERPCPLCRQTVSLFALQLAHSGDRMHFLSDDLSPLDGSIFVLRSHGEVGFASFHFERDTAYISHSSERCTFAGLVLDNGSEPPRKKMFERTFWHEGSRTFHGELNWSPATWYGAERWRIVMQFSKDLMHVTTGVMKLRSHRHACLLDGIWKVDWGDKTEGELIRVQGGMWEQRGMRYWLNLTEPTRPCFVWRGLGVLQFCELENNPQLEDGRKLVWAPWLLLAQKEYVRYQALTSEVHFRPGTPFGNCFVQNLRLGVESYHFEEMREDEVLRGYVSYENASDWPLMDNGAPVPYRVPFEKTSWDQASRSFAGEVDFVRHYSSTWQGRAQVVYKRMVFDPCYLYIESGFMQSIKLDGSACMECVTLFGRDLLYVNADAGRFLRGKGQTFEEAMSALGLQPSHSLRQAFDAAG